MSGENKKMDGKSWAILVIAIIITVLLSTISNWFNLLIQAVGRQIAWIIISVIIAILLITLIALLVAHPTAIDEILDLALSGAERVSETASKIIADVGKGVGNFSVSFLKPVIVVPLLAVFGFLIYKKVKYEKI